MKQIKLQFKRMEFNPAKKKSNDNNNDNFIFVNKFVIYIWICISRRRPYIRNVDIFHFRPLSRPVSIYSLIPPASPPPLPPLPCTIHKRAIEKKSAQHYRFQFNCKIELKSRQHQQQLIAFLKSEHGKIL